MILPKQTISFSALKKMGHTEEEIKKMVATHSLFPTPFKGIYYVPMSDEKKSRVMQNPFNILTMAISIYLGTDKFYYTCRTAEEKYGIKWHPSGLIHIVNEKISKRIDLKKRVELKKARRTYYSKTSASILSQYGNEIIFHKTKTIKDCKFKQTPYGRYAYKSQIKIDKKRFRCK